VSKPDAGSQPEPPDGGWLDPRAALAAPPADPLRARVRAWLALQARGALAPAAAREALARAGGDPAAALRALTGEAPTAVLGEGPFAAACAALARAGARLLPLGAAAYPARLAALADPPPLLAVRGAPAALAAPLVAIVGARAATPYGVGCAKALARQLAGLGFGIVSGLARGIDAAAHRGALEAGGATIGVLACGVDRVYPREHEALAEEMTAAGAVLSELPIGSPPLRHHFPLRNRLISGLADALVVVEARARSGSRISAEHAAEQGREVLAVPGPIDAPASEGPNLLLREGAAPALDASDVLRALGRGAEAEAWLARRRRAPGGDDAHALAPEARALLAALQGAPATRDELAARLGLAPAALAAPLLALELDGRVAEDRAGRLRIVPR
jgi:DNA processing protein